jgi:hypothetical protein
MLSSTTGINTAFNEQNLSWGASFWGVIPKCGRPKNSVRLLA